VLRRPAEREDRLWWNDSTKSSCATPAPLARTVVQSPSARTIIQAPPMTTHVPTHLSGLIQRGIPMFHVKHPAAATTSATRRPRCGCFTPRTRDAAESAVKQRVRDCQRRHDPGTPTCVCAHRANSLRFTQVATAVRAGSGRIFGHHRTAGPTAVPTMAQPVIRTTYWSRSASRHPHRFAPSSEASPTGASPTIGTTQRRGGVSRETSQDQHPAKHSSVHTASLPPQRRPRPPVSARMGGIGDSCRAFVAAARRTPWPVRTFTRRVADPCHIAADR
jgi:hypothetical protein